MSEESDFAGFKKIAIIGCGLIGGSMGLALKKNHFPDQIFGIDRQEVIEKALAYGAIDKGSKHIEEGLNHADMVILATPVKEIIRMFTEIKPFLSKQCLVTDTGSTKTDILTEARKVFTHDFDFIGGHPMAGLEKGGIEYAQSDLFSGKPYLVVYKEGNSHMASLKMSSFIQHIGALEINMNAVEHDRVVALVSHFPQLIAVSMTNLLGSLVEKENNENYFNIGGNVFNEMTRVASSPFNIWEDIFQTNQKWTIQAIEELEKMLKSIKQKIIQNPAGLEIEFSKARQLKERILKINKYTR